MLQPAISHTQDQEVPGLQRESQAKFTMDKQLLFEKHYSPQQIAALWGRSGRFIRELFQDEPGVQKVDRPEKMHKRRYSSIRVPESVMVRVGLRLQNGPRTITRKIRGGSSLQKS